MESRKTLKDQEAPARLAVQAIAAAAVIKIITAGIKNLFQLS